jgi:transcriptional regulator with XRE-family HTH domain
MKRDSDTRKSVDLHVGVRLRELRRYLGWSKEYLADLMGLSARRINAYEAGTRRIDVTHLVEFAALTQAPLAYFFADIGVARYAAEAPRTAALRAHRMTLQLVRAFSRIRTDHERQAILAVIENVVDAVEGASLKSSAHHS